MGRKDSLDLEMEAVSGALEANGSSRPEDVLPLLQQADELHHGSKQDRQEGFQLLLNNKLAVRLRLWLPSLLSLPSLHSSLLGSFLTPKE
jgi:hypothetical protein